MKLDSKLQQLSCSWLSVSLLCVSCVFNYLKQNKTKQDDHLNKEKAFDKNNQKTRNGRNLPVPNKEHQQNKTHLKSYLVVKGQMLSL